MKLRTGELSVHHQLLQHRLAQAAKAHNHALIVLLGPALAVKAHRLPGWTKPDQSPGRERADIEHMDVTEAVALL